MPSKLKRPRRKVRADGRSAGEPQHVRLYHWLLNSPAYRSLSCPVRCLLVELYAHYNGRNNGELFLSVRRAADRLGTGKATASRAFRELEDKGFIRARQRGSFHWKAAKATCWILTEFEFAGASPTKDFMRMGRVEKENSVPQVKPDGPSRETARSRKGLKNSVTVPPVKPQKPKNRRQRFHDEDANNLPTRLVFERGSGIGARFFADATRTTRMTTT